jgi:hypothetical protein
MTTAQSMGGHAVEILTAQVLTSRSAQYFPPTQTKCTRFDQIGIALLQPLAQRGDIESAREMKLLGFAVHPSAPCQAAGDGIWTGGCQPAAVNAGGGFSRRSATGEKASANTTDSVSDHLGTGNALHVTGDFDSSNEIRKTRFPVGIKERL